MRTTSAPTASAAKILLGACAVVAAMGLDASPAWANQTAQHRHFPLPVVTSTTTTVPGGTTTTTSTTTALGLPLPQPPTAAPEDTCVQGAWPQAVEGRPATFQAGNDGVYLWHDPDGGWALRATHSGPHDRVIIAGTLHTTTGKFTFVHRVRDEGNDIVALSANHKTILFRFVNYGWVDGLDFATHCSTGFSASFYIEGTLAPTDAVHLGGNEVNPTSNPFDIERVQGSLGSDGGVPTTTTSTTSSAATTAMAVS
jgi:hypothetical protein